jgi:hypothetical protein
LVYILGCSGGVGKWGGVGHESGQVGGALHRGLRHKG